MKMDSPDNIYNNLFSNEAREAAALAADIAKKYNHNIIDVEHVFLAFLEQDNGIIKRILENIGVDLISIHDKTRRKIQKIFSIKIGSRIYISKRVKALIDMAAKEAFILNNRELLPEHIFLAMFDDEHKGRSPVAKILSEYNIKKDDVYKQIKKVDNA